MSDLRRFGSVTVLNGHIHQIVQKVEGNITFHTARSTAYPQPVAGEGAGPGPLKVPADAAAQDARRHQRVGHQASALTRVQRRVRSQRAHAVDERARRGPAPRSNVRYGRAAARTCPHSMASSDGRSRGAQFRGNPLGGGHDAQHVLAGDLGDIAVRPAAAHEFDQQRRIAVDAFEARGASGMPSKSEPRPT